MFFSNIAKLRKTKFLSNMQTKYIFTSKNNYPIKFILKDFTFYKYHRFPYTILNKMEENFESKLISIGKIF
jgi:hypothetical protein